MNGGVSVIIPVRDGERYLGEAIESVLQQTRVPEEVIVVDNGSRDRSKDIALSFGGTVCVLEEPVQGPAHARNTGIRAAAGGLLAFLDADDVWEPSKLARQIEILEAHPEIDAVFTNMREFISPELDDELRKNLRVRSEDHAGLLLSTLLSRAESFRSIGPLPELPVGEFIAWYGMAQKAGWKCYTIPEVLVRRRIHLSNTTRRSRKDMGGYLKAAKMVLDLRRAPGS
jgi:glycosyltransferase involved in cell wall biosynthesis